MKKNMSSESGQAIIMIVISIVVLLGFTALAIDGGMVLSDRRHAQNSADSAALAGALQKVNGASDAEIGQAALFSALANGFDAAIVDVIITPVTDFSGSYHLVTVTITSTTQTSFVQMFWGESGMRNRVTATARVRLTQPALPGTAIVGMGDCTSNVDHVIAIAGGGNSGDVRTFDGGVFLNSPEAGNAHCAIDPPPSGVIAIESGYSIYTVGNQDYTSNASNLNFDNVSPRPALTGINGGSTIDDPLTELPDPVCAQDGSIAANGHYQPGNYDRAAYTSAPEIGPGIWDKGLYCVSGNISLSGQEKIDATSGVTLYMIDGGIYTTGQAGIQIIAPDNVNPDGSVCDPENKDPSDSCTFQAVAIFMARRNPQPIDLQGNGTIRITGLVYALNTTMTAGGGGSSADEYTVLGQIIAKAIYSNGNGSFNVVYNAGRTYWKPPLISLER
ncbi:MAG: hypothetical protein EHM70_18405 [Chloroflexota bacterium]|nr:MAG: hypothetical protein EHM70_18405 [Chloroflexota bacterium]